MGVFAGPGIVAVVASVVLALPVFITSGLYRAIFRYSGLPAMVAVARAMVLYGIAFAAIFTFWGVEGVPRTVGLIQPMLLLLVGASRAAARVWLGGLYHQQLRKAALPQALIYGAGSAGRQLASAMANMGVAPSLVAQQLAFFGVSLFELDAFCLGRFDQFDASGLEQLAVGGVGDGFLLDGGVDNDAAEFFAGNQFQCHGHF